MCECRLVFVGTYGCQCSAICVCMSVEARGQPQGPFTFFFETLFNWHLGHADWATVAQSASPALKLYVCSTVLQLLKGVLGSSSAPPNKLCKV